MTKIKNAYKEMLRLATIMIWKNYQFILDREKHKIRINYVKRFFFKNYFFNKYLW